MLSIILIFNFLSFSITSASFIVPLPHLIKHYLCLYLPTFIFKTVTILGKKMLLVHQQIAIVRLEPFIPIGNFSNKKQGI